MGLTEGGTIWLVRRFWTSLEVLAESEMSVMSDTSFLFCPSCSKRAFRLGKCLQCGFRGEGSSELSKEQRIRSLERPKPRRSSDYSGDDVDIDSDGGIITFDSANGD